MNGPNAMYPCISCEVSKNNLVEREHGNPRTLKNLVINHSYYDKNDVDKEKCKSCVARVIVNTEVEDNIVPLPLHIILGLVNQLFKTGEKKMLEWDEKKYPIQKKQQQRLTFHLRWKKIMNGLNVRLAKQHGGQLTGDACQRLLYGYRFLSTAFIIGTAPTKHNPLPEPEEKYNDDVAWSIRYMSLIIKMKDIHSLIMRPTPLCNHEIKQVSSLVADLGMEWRDMFDNVTPKLHQLEVHVPIFLAKHGTIGMCSEQSLERQHKLFNRLDHTFRTMGEEEDRMRSIMKQVHLQEAYDIIVENDVNNE